jgi:hypothetical protein
MSWTPQMVATLVRKPGDPRSTALQWSIKRCQRSCATLRASRLLIDLSLIGIARSRKLLEQYLSQNGRLRKQSPHERGVDRWAQRADRPTYSVTNSSAGIRNGSSPRAATTASRASVA